MRFSFNWLRRHLVTSFSLRQVADRLTAIGLEVENLQDPAEIFKKFKLVRIDSVEKHPNADTLNVCIVRDDDGATMRIVCGAKNVRVGLKSVLAMPGAVVPASGEVLKRSKIRGIESEGMMCSPAELALSAEKNGIVDVGDDVDLSTPVGDALGYDGGIIDVSVTPNRGDCLSVKGIARDLAASGVGSFIEAKKIVVDSAFKFPLKIDCDRSEACEQYAPVLAFRVIRNIRNGESPEWVRSLLQSAGMKSISAVVDLANWFMLDSGRPLHIYDLGKINGGLSVRFAKNQEKFVDLKGATHELRDDMLVCADSRSTLCLMGVMGSAEAACDENTTDILLESALFDPVFVSKTGSFLNLISDSRSMFERGVDRSFCVPGLETITRLILDHCGGEASAVMVVGDEPEPKPSVTLRREKLLAVGCGEVDWNMAKAILANLGLIEISSDEDKITCAVPSWRSDIALEEDLIEEILRIVGYDQIPSQRIENVAVGTDKILSEKKLVTAAMRLLASCGLSEVVTYSFMNGEHAEVFSEDNALINLINPISVDLDVLRPSLIPNLLLTAKRSLNYGRSGVEICESGNVFQGDGKQELHISGLRAGLAHERNWLQKTRSVDVFDVKSDLLALLEYFGVKSKNVLMEFPAPSYYHPSRSGALVLGRRKFGYFGELHPKINKIFGMGEKVVCFELLCSSLLYSKSARNSYASKVFPKINRDFSFVFDAKVAIGNVVAAVYKLDQRISNVDVFDCYSVSELQNSLGIAVVLEVADRTLTEDEAAEVSDKIIAHVASVGGELRTK
ncbi:MAG: phenylalanine--tRNA ligase subunit beta [Holosporaceae bacterium]|jgi:phenylalanyl-tRNA synthetase beta chain|nr:phenylalanine--tRNA ligase subunit beta [Holosporaceae bacterium]